ncbi:MAG: prepilin-type N-terminal cleavage/methylation domain-containing protein [Lentisphaeria bacterium]|nr:prepilin-type N-terminal cleavage/methylation domain-containing protein [Lentisphaeria bacterium]
MKKTKKNFTLVELLCAVALVVILAGIGFSAYSYASHRGKEAATRSLITRLEAGLETLKTKHGFYPASASFGDITVDLNSAGVIDGITFGTQSITNAKQLKDFLSVVDGENLKKYVSNGNLTDAWGGRIQYKYPGAVNTAKYDIIAPGADEHFGKAGTSTSPCASLADYKDNDEWACDDIANFDKL